MAETTPQDRADAIANPLMGDRWEQDGEMRIVARTFTPSDAEVPVWVAPVGSLFERVELMTREEYRDWCSNATLIRRGA